MESPRTPWEGLDPPYRTLVVDPPWHYEQAYPQDKLRPATSPELPYSSMSLEAIRDLNVGGLATDARCFLWTTNRHLRYAWSVLEAWGFQPQNRLLVWCKTPQGTRRVTTEFVLVGKCGRPEPMPWYHTTWFQWPNAGHSTKPDAFFDLVESWCPGPRVELFARAPRLGWDHWGFGYESESA